MSFAGTWSFGPAVSAPSSSGTWSFGPAPSAPSYTWSYAAPAPSYYSYNYSAPGSPVGPGYAAATGAFGTGVYTDLDYPVPRFLRGGESPYDEITPNKQSVLTQADKLLLIGLIGLVLLKR